MTFPEIIKTWLDLHEDDEGPDTNDAVETLATEFEIAGSTVRRWGVGTGEPHPRIQTQVLKHISESIEWHQRYSGYCGCDWCNGCAEINAAIKERNE